MLEAGLSYALMWGLCVALLLRSLGRLVVVDLGLDARGQIADGVAAGNPLDVVQGVAAQALNCCGNCAIQCLGLGGLIERAGLFQVVYIGLVHGCHGICHGVGDLAANALDGLVLDLLGRGGVDGSGRLVNVCGCQGCADGQNGKKKLGQNLFRGVRLSI